MTNVVVIGGGVIGLLSAVRLAQAGASVSLFDKGEPGEEASAAALGVLAPTAGPNVPLDYLRLSQASLALYPPLAQELRSATEIDIELRDEGLLLVALDETETAALPQRQKEQDLAGITTRLLPARATRRMEPALGENVLAALHFSEAKQVNNIRLCRALALLAGQLGVKIQRGRPVTAIRQKYGQLTGIQVGSERVRADWVVVAAGCWSGAIAGLLLPVRPAKGQALALSAPVVLSHMLDSGEVYIVPRRDGRLLVGATVEEAGYDKRVTAGGIGELLAGAIRLLPVLQEATVLQSWAGLRPRPADDLPIIGPMESCQGLVAATGHYRNGILLAPITAQLVCDTILGRTPAVDAHIFSPTRFLADSRPTPAA